MFSNRQNLSTADSISSLFTKIFWQLRCFKRVQICVRSNFVWRILPSACARITYPRVSKICIEIFETTASYCKLRLTTASANHRFSILNGWFARAVVSHHNVIQHRITVYCNPKHRRNYSSIYVAWFRLFRPKIHPQQTRSLPKNRGLQQDTVWCGTSILLLRGPSHWSERGT